MKKNINGNEVEMTAEEISELEEHQLDLANKETIEKQEEETAKTAKANLKASAKAKLMSGEALTEDEANTIVL